jgi:hypothetical protein
MGKSRQELAAEGREPVKVEDVVHHLTQDEARRIYDRDFRHAATRPHQGCLGNLRYEAMAGDAAAENDTARAIRYLRKYYLPGSTFVVRVRGGYHTRHSLDDAYGLSFVPEVEVPFESEFTKESMMKFLSKMKGSYASRTAVLAVLLKGMEPAEAAKRFKVNLSALRKAVARQEKNLVDNLPYQNSEEEEVTN